jgi:hypothetical protein
MIEIPLIQTANQNLSIDLESRQWSITLKEAQGVMVADITIDGTEVVTGSPVLAGEPVIPYGYLQNGNLILSTLDDALPYWDQFGVTQGLFYLTDAEMAG